MKEVAYCKFPCGCIIKPSDHFLLPLLFRVEDCKIVHRLEWDDSGAPYLTQPPTMADDCEMTISIATGEEKP